MQLQLKPHNTNMYPIGAVLVKGDKIKDWLKAIQLMKLPIGRCKVYPLPGQVVNSIWGCLVVLPKGVIPEDIGPYFFCQEVSSNFFIPAQAVLFPTMSMTEINTLFKENIYLFHSEIGLTELTEQIIWIDQIKYNPLKAVDVIKPAPGAFIPNKITRLELYALPVDNIIQEMEQKLFPEKKVFADKPLSTIEKIKLWFLAKAFKQRKERMREGNGGNYPALLKLLPYKLKSILGHMLQRWMGKLESVYEDLDKRNKEEADKLLDLFNKNPEEALKYAIPLNNSGRGSEKGHIKISKRWSDFSFNKRETSSVTIVLQDDVITKLTKQYHQTADQLIEKGDFHKAAFVYMKLLYNNLLAAKTLEQGKLYAEAAAIYVKEGDKLKAAECYEFGNMYTQAIDIYKELRKKGKVGDLYRIQGKEEDANRYYYEEAEDNIRLNDYVTAATIYKRKINDMDTAQQLLRKGWKEQADAYNCLTNYFNNMEDEGTLKNGLEDVFLKDLNASNNNTFLDVIKNEYQQYPELRERIREMGYHIISESAVKEPSIVGKLKYFNDDMQLTKDILRFKVKETSKKEQ